MRRELEISARSDGDKTIEHENGIGDTMSANAERQRLEEARGQHVPWRKCGPYLSERQWGTVREDYSEDGNAWDVTRHDVSRDRGAISRDDPARNSPTGCAFGHDGRRGSVRPIPGTAPVRYQHPRRWRPERARLVIEGKPQSEMDFRALGCASGRRGSQRGALSLANRR